VKLGKTSSARFTAAVIEAEGFVANRTTGVLRPFWCVPVVRPAGTDRLALNVPWQGQGGAGWFHRSFLMSAEVSSRVSGEASLWVSGALAGAAPITTGAGGPR
jgi:hypothetical protein